VIVAEIAGHKKLTKIQGRVEFTMDYENHEMFGHDPEDPHWETEDFANLTQFLGLISGDFIEQMRRAHGAKRVTITHIYLDGRNDEGDQGSFWIGPKMQAWATATVNSEHIESRMITCVEELEKDLQRALSTIQRHRI
jgi:hypothetical protein